MSGLIERLQALAESLEGCEWNHPITAAADVLEAAVLIDMLTRKMCRRRCHDCGHVGWYVSGRLPECLCEECQSADTQLVREPKARESN